MKQKLTQKQGTIDKQRVVCAGFEKDIRALTAELQATQVKLTKAESDLAAARRASALLCPRTDLDMAQKELADLRIELADAKEGLKPMQGLKGELAKLRDCLSQCQCKDLRRQLLDAEALKSGEGNAAAALKRKVSDMSNRVKQFRDRLKDTEAKRGADVGDRDATILQVQKSLVYFFRRTGGGDRWRRRVAETGVVPLCLYVRCCSTPCNASESGHGRTNTTAF